MKKLMVICLLGVACLAAPAWGEEFLGLSLPLEGQTIASSEDMLQKAYKQAPEQVLQFFKDQLKGHKDIRFREFGGNYVVEDFGVLPWNKVLISKDRPSETTITVTKDSWTWIVGMLTLRFTGVFVVLVALYLATSLATNFIARTLNKQGQEGD